MIEAIGQSVCLALLLIGEVILFKSNEDIKKRAEMLENNENKDANSRMSQLENTVKILKFLADNPKKYNFYAKSQENPYSIVKYVEFLENGEIHEVKLDSVDYNKNDEWDYDFIDGKREFIKKEHISKKNTKYFQIIYCNGEYKSIDVTNAIKLEI